MKYYYKAILFSFGIASCAPHTQDQGMALVSTGELIRYEQFSSEFVKPRTVDVWLPESYSDSGSYAVLYMHDGQMLFDSTQTWNGQEWGVDETVGKLQIESTIKSCIVVAVWNTESDRHADYFPQKPFSSLDPKLQDSLLHLQPRLFTNTIQSDAYLKFLVLELKPFIDSTFSVIKNKENTFIAGSSMGGLISMYAVMEYPAVFGGAICMSTHWLGIFSVDNNPIPPLFINYIAEHLPDPKKGHRFYFDFGTEGLDANYSAYQAKVDSVFRSFAYPARQYMSLKFTGADHSERAWCKRFSIPVQFLLGTIE